MPHRISFELANGTSKFYPGDKIEGVVIFNLDHGITGVES